MPTPSTSRVVTDFCTVETSKKRLTMSVGLRPSKAPISAREKWLAKASAVRTKRRRCRHSATNVCNARSTAATSRNPNITSDSATTGQSSTPKATVLTSASIAAGTTMESRPTPRAKARSVIKSERSRRKSCDSRCQGRLWRCCVWPVVDAVTGGSCKEICHAEGHEAIHSSHGPLGGAHGVSVRPRRRLGYITRTTGSCRFHC